MGKVRSLRIKKTFILLTKHFSEFLEVFPEETGNAQQLILPLEAAPETEKTSPGVKTLKPGKFIKSPSERMRTYIRQLYT